MREAADILVAGAGPAGLTLALQAHDHSAAVRVVDGFRGQVAEGGQLAAWLALIGAGSGR